MDVKWKARMRVGGLFGGLFFGLFLGADLFWGGMGMAVSGGAQSGDGWAVYQVDEVERERRSQDRSYLEFFRADDMSAGLYVLPAGTDDQQSPHTEDEIYYILSGRADIRMGENQVAVSAGSVVYVKAKVPHRFLNIEEDLSILVVFAPAFGSRQQE